MLSYRHGFHAGNFADVFKHALLLELIAALKRKDAAFFVLDTHAGAGLYDLRSVHAQRLREFDTGIGRLWQTETLPQELLLYRDLVRSFNPTGQLRSYPGSPLLLQRVLRPQDRLALAELHPTDHANLEQAIRVRPGVELRHEDGLAVARALMPPPENRGLVFIDPPYELQREWRQVVKTVQEIHRRWRGGMLAIWYPLLPGRSASTFVQGLAALAIPKTLAAEIEVGAVRGSHGMYGCGVAVINPPWQLDTWLGGLLPSLMNLLAVESPRWRLNWLVAEKISKAH
ncbi:MAG: 23S rRNA (adenine(2030)-N(6))-methyltransferase RlmJ [Nevskiales bacterium]